MSTSPIPAKPKGVKNEFFASSRITVHSMLPFSRVIENLTLELGDPNLPIWRTIVASVTRKNRDKKAAFELEIKNAIGKHGFMAFHEFDHGAWIPLFGLGSTDKGDINPGDKQNPEPSILIDHNHDSDSNNSDTTIPDPTEFNATEDEPHYLGLKRIVFGNPLIAITMLECDLTAGLAVPLELLVLEKRKKEGGGTDLIYNLPSSLIEAGTSNPGLRDRARELDTRVREMVKEVGDVGLV